MKNKLIFALKIWVAIYPSITLLLYFFNEPLNGLPLYQKTLLLTIILVPWMIFIMIPFVEKVIGLFARIKK